MATFDAGRGPEHLPGEGLRPKKLYVRGSLPRRGAAFLDAFPRFPVLDRVSIVRREKPDLWEAALADV